MRRKVTGVIAAVLLLGCAYSFSAAQPGEFYCSGSSKKKVIALTFDDGPGRCTNQVLEILKKYRVKATFFMEGSQVEMRPALARLVHNEGHEVGSHTYSHINFYAYKKADKEQKLSSEISKAQTLLTRATGRTPNLLRMPNGFIRSWVKDVARRENYTLVNWTFGCDWQKMSSDALAEAYIKNLRPGAIFLMHDGGGNRDRTVQALPRIIEAARQQGYDIVPVSTLLNLTAESPATARADEAGE